MKLEDSVRYSNALSFASKLHASQQRKDKTPYILHPIKVSMILAKKGFDVRYQIAGLFHDLLEDTVATEDDLKEFCDEEMLTAVRLVTKVQGQSEMDYINNILGQPMAKEIKNADRIDNLSDLNTSKEVKFKERYLRQTELFFVGKFSPELDELYYKIMNSCVHDI